MRWFTLLVTLCSAAVFVSAQQNPTEKILFDFESAADLNGWSNLELPDAKQKEPPIKFESSTENAPSGKRSLKLTFSGGRWPTLITREIPDDWMAFNTFTADVTVSRPCLVGFAVLQEKSRRGGDWDGAVSRWTKTALLKPGRNEMVGILHPNDYSAILPALGKVVSFEIFTYQPRVGETIYVDNVRLSSVKQVVEQPKTQFKVLGTDMTVANVQELGKLLKDKWTKPTPKTVEQVEAEFKAEFNALKKKHPQAVRAIFRDGEKGYNGWKDAYWTSHGPDGMTVERAENFGKAASQEIFMRHRSPLMQVDLSSVPKGSEILTAKLVIVRANDTYEKGRHPIENPNVWVVEPCNRAWDEQEVNAYQYAKDKYWKAVGGMHWGDDPDFLPFYVAYGAGGGHVSIWDFKEAVKFWTDGTHANYGFMLHGDSYDWMMRAHYRESSEVKSRPAVMVIYVPKR
jgi:hypothetical protein